MKILYYNVISQNRGWGAEYFFDKALCTLGHETCCIDYRLFRSILAQKTNTINTDVNCVLLQRGERFPHELLKAIHRPRFFWASELVTRRRDQDVHFSSGLFSHVFVRGVACRNSVIEKGWLLPEQVSILLSGFDPEIFKRDTSIEKDIDILFVGSITERRKAILSELQKEFHIEWQKVYGTELSLYINRAKIVLNIHAEEYLDVETRVFEVLGSGGFLITEKLAQENPFKNGVHLIETESIQEMSKKIRWYLSRDQERNEISDHGYKEAVHSHTYDSRASFVSDIMKKYTKSASLELFDRQTMKKLIFKEKLRGIVVIPILAGVTFLRKIKKVL